MQMPESKNPWKTLNVTEVYDNPWIHIDEHDVINPSGNPGIYGKIHFKNIACGIIPLDDDNTTWIVGQYRYALDRYSWEIPMGGVVVGTDLIAGAQRELKEETGLTAVHWKKILDVDLSNSITDEVGVVFVAEGLKRGKPEFEDTEQIEIRELPFDDLVQMALDGQITDVLSVAGILKLATMKSAQD
jgi:8-oxo-dGTP pyrophosphatase MutT (NUDIX family)